MSVVYLWVQLMQRTDWMEIFLQRLAEVPLTAECVFRSPKYLSADKKAHEVCDHILLLRNDGILVSLKCQENPTRRSREKLQNWAAKAAKDATRQAKGAVRTLQNASIYCEHSRRGRVDFGANKIAVSHLLIVIEVCEAVTLPADLALYDSHIPISYLSLDDFLNMITQLRAHPDIKKYLNARRMLPRQELLIVGAERPLYEYYLLSNESFENCAGIQDAVGVLGARPDELRDAVRRKSEADMFALAIERVSDKLSERHPKYRDGLDAHTLAGFDDPTKRARYLILQENLCDLFLAARRIVGRQLQEVIRNVEQDANPESIRYGVAYADAKPDFVYILVSSKGIPRIDVIYTSNALLLGALAHYGKNAGMFIVDRDHVSYEVGFRESVTFTPEIHEFGRQHFAHLKMAHDASTLVPQSCLAQRPTNSQEKPNC
jgi:hypothetical protein